MIFLATAGCSENSKAAEATVRNAEDVRKWVPGAITDTTTARETELAEMLVSGSSAPISQLDAAVRELEKLDAGASLALAPCWERGLSNAQAIVRRYSLGRLARLRDAGKPYIAKIRAIMANDPDGHVKSRAAWALAAINGIDVSVVEELGVQLDAAQGEAKVPVLESLTYYAAQLGAIEAKVEALTRHEDPHVSRRAISLYNMVQAKSYVQGQLMTETQRKTRLADWVKKSQGEIFVFGRETCGLTMGKYREFKAAGKNPLLVDIDQYAEASQDMDSLLAAKTSFRGGMFMLPVVLADGKVWYRK